MFVQGKFYLLIEELSQLFRALVPIQLWYKYIMGEDPSNSYFLGATLIIIYSLCKVSAPEGKIVFVLFFFLGFAWKVSTKDLLSDFW